MYPTYLSIVSTKRNALFCLLALALVLSPAASHDINMDNIAVFLDDNLHPRSKTAVDPTADKLVFPRDTFLNFTKGNWYIFEENKNNELPILEFHPDSEGFVALNLSSDSNNSLAYIKKNEMVISFYMNFPTIFTLSIRTVDKEPSTKENVEEFLKSITDKLTGSKGLDFINTLNHLNYYKMANNYSHNMQELVDFNGSFMKKVTECNDRAQAAQKLENLFLVNYDDQTKNTFRLHIMAMMIKFAQEKSLKTLRNKNYVPPADFTNGQTDDVIELYQKYSENEAVMTNIDNIFLSITVFAKAIMMDLFSSDHKFLKLLFQKYNVKASTLNGRFDKAFKDNVGKLIIKDDWFMSMLAKEDDVTQALKAKLMIEMGKLNNNLVSIYGAMKDEEMFAVDEIVPNSGIDGNLTADDDINGSELDNLPLPDNNISNTHLSEPDNVPLPENNGEQLPIFEDEDEDDLALSDSLMLKNDDFYNLESLLVVFMQENFAEFFNIFKNLAKPALRKMELNAIGKNEGDKMDPIYTFAMFRRMLVVVGALDFNRTLDMEQNIYSDNTVIFSTNNLNRRMILV